MKRSWTRLGGGAARAILVLVAGVVPSAIATPLAADPAPPLARPLDKRDRKDATVDSSSPPLLATLVDTHSSARLALDDLEPSPARFEAMLADPVVRTTHPVAPELLALVRSLARLYPLGRIEVVSGFRSPKLNEALRKKGHHVASHSQHSLGHALDLRIVPDGAETPLDPEQLARVVRRLGWRGGVGIYESPNDRFMHADVGDLRTWHGQ